MSLANFFPGTNQVESTILSHGDFQKAGTAACSSATWYSGFARRCQVPRPPRLLCAFRKSFDSKSCSANFLFHLFYAELLPAYCRCRFHLVCPGIKFGERNFFWAWYKLKFICLLYFHFVPSPEKVSLAKFFPETGGGNKPSGIDNITMPPAYFSSNRANFLVIFGVWLLGEVRTHPGTKRITKIYPKNCSKPPGTNQLGYRAKFARLDDEPASRKCLWTVGL